MDHQHHHDSAHDAEQPNRNAFVIGLSILISGAFVLGAWAYARNLQSFAGRAQHAGIAEGGDAIEALESVVIPVEGYVLPITWGDLGKRMISEGVIDEVAFRKVYIARGGLNSAEQAMLSGNSTEPIRITRANANFVLNMLWAYGLAQKSPILERGEMTDPQYGGAGNFASTGGWTLSRGDSMQHYSAHAFVSLTDEQWAMVDRVSRGIFRPCCGNSTHFPDCNHGMAMLGLLALMAANNVSEADMYKAALQVNAYWFPDTYLTIAKYFKAQGVEWSSVDPKLALSAEYSSGRGFQRIRAAVDPVVSSASGGCAI